MKHTSWLLRCLGTLASVASLTCAPAGVAESPRLPSDGIANLREGATPGSASSPEDSDPWSDKELISPPAAKPPKALELPEIERFTLRNGLEVIAVRDDTLPVVSLQLALRVGKRDVPREKAGLAQLTAEMLLRGTRKRSAAVIAEEIDAVGGAIGANASYEATLLSCKAMSQDLGTCLQIMPDVLVHPTFPDSEASIVRKDLLASVRQRLDDAGRLASAHFQSALWADDHPRGWITSAGTLEAISRDDMRKWHKQWIRPDRATLAVAGDFDSSKLKSTLNRAFRRWRSRGSAPKRRAIDASEPGAIAHNKGIKVRLVDKPGQTQSHIRVGHLGIAHDDPDFYNAMVFNYSLGGGAFASRLMRVVRSREGKAYTATSSFDRNMDAGAFVAATFTRTSETIETVRLVRDVMVEMAEKGPTASEVKEATTNLAGAYGIRFESAEDVAGAVLAAHLHGFEDDYVGQYPLRIADVSVEKARQAASRILDPGNAVIVIVGDGSKVEAQLEEAGWEYETLAHTAPVSNWEREARDAPPEVEDDPAKVAEARKVLDQALAAKGGAKKLEGLKTFSWKGRAELSLPGGKAPAVLQKRYIAPDKLRLDMKIGNGQIEIVTVLAGNSGWAREVSPRGEKKTRFDEEQLQALRTQLWRDQDLVLLRHREKGAVVQPLSDRIIDGKKQHAIRVTSVDGLRKVLLLIDQKTKMLTGLEYSDVGMKTSERFGDYKKVDGIQVAHSRSTKSSEVDLRLDLQSITFDKKIAPFLFLPPQDASKRAPKSRKSRSKSR